MQSDWSERGSWQSHQKVLFHCRWPKNSKRPFHRNFHNLLKKIPLRPDLPLDKDLLPVKR
jgi:hypothetical protein